MMTFFIFVKQVGNSIVILLLYVGDIIITGNAIDAIYEIITIVTKEPWHYFLCIQIVHKHDGLFPSQDKYVIDLLTKSEMLLSKP